MPLKKYGCTTCTCTILYMQLLGRFKVLAVNVHFNHDGLILNTFLGNYFYLNINELTMNLIRNERINYFTIKKIISVITFNLLEN